MSDEVMVRLSEAVKLADKSVPVISSEEVGKVCHVDGLTPTQLTMLVSACYMESTETGRLEPPATIWKNWGYQLSTCGITQERLVGLWRDADFLDAIYKRGIRSKDNGLDSRMILALAVLTDFTTKATVKTRLSKIGVKQFEYAAWLNYPPFADRLAKMSNKILGGSVGNAKVSLANLAVDGNLNAIKFLFEVTGEHDPQKQAQFDGERLVRGMAEIMMTYITDPEMMREAAGKIQILLASNGVVQ